MYKEYNGREWSSEEKYLEHKANVRKYFRITLALEDYSDCCGDDSIYKDEAFVLLKEYRATKDKLTEDELLEKTKIIVEKFNKLLDIVGREKFTFYDDDDINFNWTK